MGFARLVYSPKAFVYVKNADGEIRDLSAYVTAGRVSRKINQLSTAEVTLRNPDMIFTDWKRGIAFTPMDPITIYLQRLRQRPVRVFTGFLDQTPWLQLYPGTVTLKASCTLKKLMYTFFDPALPYVNSFLQQYGWLNNSQGEIINPNAASQTYNTSSNNPLQPIKSPDGSIGNLLYATLKHIGHWDPDTIYIQDLPKDLPDRMAALAREWETDNKQARTEFEDLMHGIIGSGAYGNGGGSGTVPEQGNYNGPLNKLFPKHYVEQSGFAVLSSAQVKELAIAAGIPPVMFDLISKGESGRAPGVVQHDPGDGNVGWGLYQITPKACCSSGSAAGKYLEQLGGIEQMLNPWKCTLMAAFLYNHASSKIPNTRGFPWYGTTYLNGVPASVYMAMPDPKQTAMQKATENLTNTVIKKAGQIGEKLDQIGQPKIYAPIGKQGTVGRGWHEDTAGHIGMTTTSGSLHWHSGLDYGVPAGTPCIAPTDGVITMALANWSDGGMVHFKFTQDTGQIKKGTVIGWGHVRNIRVKVGDKVQGGDVVADSGAPAGGPHVHFIYRPDGSDGGGDGSADPKAILLALQKGETTPTPGGSNPGDAGGGSQTDQMYSIAQASAFAAQLDWPSIEDTVEAIGLQGQKSLMNDKPLMPFIQQLSEASLRQFQSMPNGHFYAFYPDYFGEFGRKPYWMISDVEILDGGIDLNDEATTTHVYVVGDTIPGGIDQLDRLFSGGVVNIFNAFMAGDQILNRPQGADSNKSASTRFTQLLGKGDAIRFLQRYGARPQLFEEPMIRSPYFEAFLAYQKFMLLWSRQFLTTFTFTFMPELFPGGKVGFPDHDLQCYIEEVEHTWDYESGFFTQANLSAPSVLPGATGDDLPPNMVTQQTFYQPVTHTTKVKSPKGGTFTVTPSPDALSGAPR